MAAKKTAVAEEQTLPPLELKTLQGIWISDVCEAVRSRSIPLGTLMRGTHPIEIETCLGPQQEEGILIEVFEGTEFHLEQLVSNASTIQESLWEVTGRRLLTQFFLSEPSPSVLTPRQANRVARQDRREEIRFRWGQRCTARRIENERLIRPDLPVLVGWEKTSPNRSSMVDWIIREKGAIWNTLESVVGAMNEAQAKTLLAYLIRVIELKEMDYKDFLQTDEWKALATWSKTEHYGTQCALDVTHTSEHAHHRTYQRRGREYLSDLIPLCSECHAKFHNKTPR